MATTTGTWRFSDVERMQWEKDGYLVRERLFGADDVARIREAAEQLVSDVEAAFRDVERQERGGYVFNVDPETALLVKWEGHNHVLLGLEHFLDRSEGLREYTSDPRFTELMEDAIGVDAVSVYTEKLNLKRAREGGPIETHQDYPYWTGADDVDRLVTALLYLDDATTENGCLLVGPGSHKLGVLPTLSGTGLMDESAFDTSTMVPLAAPAGSIGIFGPLLVHKSLNNESDRDRRALLFTYQPAGLRTSAELRKEREARGS
jgi:phytanoyl-CoA hydroxylase